MGAYKRDFHETKSMYFLIKEDELLEKYKKTSFHNNKIPKIVLNLFVYQ